MKSKIKSLSRKEQETNIVFRMDNQIIKNIEKTFQELIPKFKLSNYKKIYAGKVLDNFWELNKRKEDFGSAKKDFGFTLIIRKDLVKFKIKGSLGFMNKFLKIMEDCTEFSELLPRVKERFLKNL